MSKKHNQLRATARELFWKHGFSRVTVEEICRVAGVSKMTFYKHYSNKTELVKSILREQIDLGMAEYRKIMGDETSFTEKITRLIQLKLEQTSDLSNEFFKEYFNSEDPELISFFSEYSGKNISLIVEEFRKAQEQGLFRGDIGVEFIMYFMNKIFSMMQDPELARHYDSSQELLMEFTRFFFYGILGNTQEANKKSR